MNLKSSTMLFAMHPDFLASFLQQGSIEALLPDALKGLASMMGGPSEAAAPADPIRDGATAIVPLRGMLGPSSMGHFRTPTDIFADRVRELGADRGVGAIVLNITSPGGYVFGNSEAADAIFEVRQAKPVIAVSNPYSYSAAHWLASQASEWHVTPSGQVGSVGVRSGHVDVSGLEAKMGIKTTLIASDPEKIAGNQYEPLSDEFRASLEEEIAEMNADFVAAIARGRGISKADVPGIHGKGGTFTAKKAKAAGIVDGISTLREVVSKFNSSRARLAAMRRQAALLEHVANSI